MQQSKEHWKWLNASIVIWRDYFRCQNRSGSLWDAFEALWHHHELSPTSENERRGKIYSHAAAIQKVAGRCDKGETDFSTENFAWGNFGYAQECSDKWHFMSQSVSYHVQTIILSVFLPKPFGHIFLSFNRIKKILHRWFCRTIIHKVLVIIKVKVAN